MARASTLLLLTLALACDSGDATQVLDARIITTDDANPLSTGEYDTLRISWAQAGYETITREIDLSGETFEVPFDFDPIATARVRVELSGPSGTVHGAPPAFLPVAAYPFLWVVVGEPGTCAVVRRFDAREPARSDSGYVRWEGFVLQFGGLAASGSSDHVTFSDLYYASAPDPDGTPLQGLPESAGRTRAAVFGTKDAVVVSEGGVWRYQLDGASVEGTERAVPMTLHPNVSIASALARNELGVVLVAGGGDDAMPAPDLARVAADGRVTLGGLVGARAFPGVAPAGDDAMVVAGGTREPGAAFVEWVGLADLVPMPIDEPTEPAVRRDPLVFEGESSHWIVGGTDASGVPVTTSWVLSGCPESCTLAPGPDVDLGTAPRADGLTLTDGSSVFTAVEDGGWHLEPVAPLAQERLTAGITVYESGMVFVHGGRDADGPRLDGELCFPAALTPLD